jgi:hypothetical protein
VTIFSFSLFFDCDRWFLHISELLYFRTVVNFTGTSLGPEMGHGRRGYRRLGLQNHGLAFYADEERAGAMNIGDVCSHNFRSVVRCPCSLLNISVQCAATWFLTNRRFGRSRFATLLKRFSRNPTCVHNLDCRPCVVLFFLLLVFRNVVIESS